MLGNLLDTEVSEERADDYSRPAVRLDERLQSDRIKTQEYDSTSCREIVTLVKNDVRHEIHSVYHGPDPMTWRHSQRRLDIAVEADEACRYPNNLVFFEEKLLSCRKAIALKDVQYAIANFRALKTNTHIRGKESSKENVQEHVEFLEKMKGYYAATYEILHATARHDVVTSQHSMEFYLAYFSKAIVLPQPFGMESKLLYLESQLKSLDENDSKSIYLYVGLAPARSAYMAQRLREAAERPELEQVRLYCGIAHTNEVLFLLKNPDYIDRYLVSSPKRNIT